MLINTFVVVLCFLKHVSQYCCCKTVYISYLSTAGANLIYHCMVSWTVTTTLNIGAYRNSYSVLRVKKYRIFVFGQNFHIGQTLLTGIKLTLVINKPNMHRVNRLTPDMKLIIISDQHRTAQTNRDRLTVTNFCQCSHN